MGNFAYYNGEYGDSEKMTVSLQNRALYFGDGCYDAAFLNDGKIVDLEDHITRFFNSMKALRIEPDFTREGLIEILQNCVVRAGVRYALLYWQVDRGTAPRSHAFPKGVKPDLLVTVIEKPGIPDIYRTDTAITFEDKRFYYCNVKTLNLIPNVLANQAAAEAGAAEAIFVRPDGTVTEGSHTNVHIIKDGVIRTHEDGEMILPGITKKGMLKAVRAAGIPVLEKAFTKEELMNADEIFVTGSSTFTLRISSVDGIPAGMKDEASYRKVAEAYRDYVVSQ